MNNLASIQLVILDLDGTLYVDHQVVTGASHTIKTLRDRGYQLRFMTNTTTKSHTQLLQQLHHFGFDVAHNELVSAPQAALQYLQQQMHRHPIKIWSVVSDNISPDFAAFQQDDEQPDYVVLGDIGEAWNLSLINRIFNAVQNGAQLIALHQNKFWQTHNQLHVDIGFFVAGLQFVTGRKALVMGKPSLACFEQVLASADCIAADALLVGDDIDSDVGGAQMLGIQTALVQTGKYRAQYAAQSTIQPDLVLSDVTELLCIM